MSSGHWNLISATILDNNFKRLCYFKTFNIYRLTTYIHLQQQRNNWAMYLLGREKLKTLTCPPPMDTIMNYKVEKFWFIFSQGQLSNGDPSRVTLMLSSWSKLLCCFRSKFFPRSYRSSFSAELHRIWSRCKFWRSCCTSSCCCWYFSFSLDERF